MLFLCLINDRICKDSFVGCDSQRAYLWEPADCCSLNWHFESFFDCRHCLGFETRVYYCAVVVARIRFPRAVRFSWITAMRAPVERSLEISSTVATYGRSREFEFPAT